MNEDDDHTATTTNGYVSMIEIAALPTAVQAALVVALVLVEAVGLYVGYGMIEERLGPTVLKAIRNA